MEICSIQFHTYKKFPYLLLTGHKSLSHIEYHSNARLMERVLFIYSFFFIYGTCFTFLPSETQVISVRLCQSADTAASLHNIQPQKLYTNGAPHNCRAYLPNFHAIHLSCEYNRFVRCTVRAPTECVTCCVYAAHGWLNWPTQGQVCLIFDEFIYIFLPPQMLLSLRV